MMNKFKIARNYAFRLLGMRAYTVWEFRKKLASKGISFEVIEGIVEECLEKGYLSDFLWTENFVRFLLKKGYGLNVIKKKLQMKGISEDLSSEVISRFCKEEVFFKSITHLLETKYKDRDLQNLKECQKVINSLIYRGFDYPLIRESIDKKTRNGIYSGVS